MVTAINHDSFYSIDGFLDLLCPKCGERATLETEYKEINENTTIIKTKVYCPKCGWKEE